MSNIEIEIDGYRMEIPYEDLQQEVFEVDFSGALKVQIQNKNGKLTLLNAMDGWGENCFEEYKDKPIKIKL